MSSQDEIIPIVNLDDEIIWYKARKDITSEDIYRVSACWIKDSDWNILLAQRSYTKRNDPGKWSAAVAWTVEKWESYEHNITKETSEEISLIVNKEDLIIWKKIYLNENNHQISWQRFLYIYDWDKSVLRAEEWAVEQLKRFSPEDLKELIDSFPDDFLESVKWGLENF